MIFTFYILPPLFLMISDIINCNINAKDYKYHYLLVSNWDPLLQKLICTGQVRSMESAIYTKKKKYLTAAKITAYPFLWYKSNCSGANANLPLLLCDASTYNKIVYSTLPLWTFTCCLVLVVDKEERYARKIFFHFQFKFNEQVVRLWGKIKVAMVALFNDSKSGCIWRKISLLLLVFWKSTNGRKLVIEVFRSVLKNFLSFLQIVYSPLTCINQLGKPATCIE